MVNTIELIEPEVLILIALKIRRDISFPHYRRQSIIITLFGTKSTKMCWEYYFCVFLQTNYSEDFLMDVYLSATVYRE